MKTIPQLYQNLRRWTEILSVISKYGLADWVSQFNLRFIQEQIKTREGEVLAHHTREARIRLAFAELGPTFIKLGQLLSTRPDIVGVKLASELRQLQNNTPADPFAVVRDTIEFELGKPIEELFEDFDEKPLASASIGQVHRARLHGGEDVVVKVQHHNVERVIERDLDILSGLIALVDKRAELAPYRPKATFEELARNVRRELDFGREERNLRQFAEQFRGTPTVKIPQLFDELCTSRILTMEFIDGVEVTDTKGIEGAQIDLDLVARRGADLYMQMIFTNGFYHADPHPGNIVLMPGNVIGLIDFGMVGRLEERLREDIEEMLMALVNQDVSMLTSLICRVGAVPSDLDINGLENDVADFVGHYSRQSMGEFRVGQALNDMSEVIHRYKITMPTAVSLLLKVLVTLDGTTRLLSPTFSLLDVMRPYQRKILLQRLSPMRKVRKVRRILFDVEKLVEILPRRLTDIVEQVQTGRFDVHLDHRGLGPSINRLVLGLLASALFVGSSLLLSRQVPPVISLSGSFLGVDRLSILGAFGYAMSILIGLRLVRAISKSGHLDSK